MGFDQVSLPENFDTKPTEETKVSEVQSEAPKTETPTQEKPTEAEYLELDKLDKKLRIDGLEYDAKELRKMLMRQSDYTRKTQELTKERETIENERKFSENLYYDLRKVEQNPQLADKFKELYPEKYHAYLDSLLEEIGYKKQGVPTELLKEIKEIREFKNTLQQKEHEKEVEHNIKLIDQVMEKYSKEYKYASQAEVLTYAQRLVDQGQNLTDKEWKQIFESCHNRVKSVFDTDYRKSLEEQKQATLKAKDTGTGGGIMGQAPERVPLSKVKDRWLESLQQN